MHKHTATELYKKGKRPQEKVKGPDDSVKNTKDQGATSRKASRNGEVFLGPIHCQEEAPQFLEGCEVSILGKAKCGTKERDQKIQGDRADVGDVEVVCGLCFFLRLDEETEPEGWKQLHVGGVGGGGCQHLQVMMTQLLQTHWEEQGAGRKKNWQGSDKKLTIYVDSMDPKTAFDVARPKQDAHGWITSALLRDDTFESKFNFT